MKVINTTKRTKRIFLEKKKNSNHLVPVFESMSITSLPDGALCVAAPTRRCAVCASRDYHQADYELKYVYARGVFHANCYAELSLFGLPYDERAANSRSDSWSDDDELCDAHLAVWLG